MRYISILFILFLSSCFLFRKSFRKSEFNYTAGGQNYSTTPYKPLNTTAAAVELPLLPHVRNPKNKITEHSPAKFC
jgi:hypothetical protein